MISIFPITVLLPSLSFVYRESYTNDKIFHVSRIEVMARKLYFQISLIFTCTTHIPRTNSIPFSSEETCNHRARDDRKKERDEKDGEKDTCIESGPRQIVADFPRAAAAARETPTIYKRFEPGRIGEPPLELPPRGQQFATPW